MKIVVQKFGGTSVSTYEKRMNVVDKVKTALKNGFSPVVVVSAMGRIGEPYATDSLLSLVDTNFLKNNKVGTDLIMSCGETISAVVMSSDLEKSGLDAIPLTGAQAGIITDNNFTEARVLEVREKRLKNIIAQGRIPVITGFQGQTEEGYITTLGRGGSDTTAAVIGVALDAEQIEIYTDVDGIMTADPRIVEDANLINVISYNEVFQLADQGAKVIHPKAIEYAMQGNIPLLIKNTMSDSKGTLINYLGDKESNKIVTSLTHHSERIQVLVKYSDNENSPKYKDILPIIAANKISLDLINIFPKEQVFTISSESKDILVQLLNSINIKFSLVEDCSKITIVGSNMKGIPGVMAKIISTLNENNIEVLQTADSHMTIWCLIENKNIKNAINLLHKTFQLYN